MSGPDGVPILDAFRVVPHAIVVDHRSAGYLADGEHAAVDVCRYPGEHLPGRGAETRRPGLLNQVVIPTDPARRHDDGLRLELELSDGDPRAWAPPLD